MGAARYGCDSATPNLAAQEELQDVLGLNAIFAAKSLTPSVMPLDTRQDASSDASRTRVNADDGVSLIDILNVFLRQRWLMLGIAVAFVVATLAYKLAAARTYTVESSFIVQRREQPPVAGIAAQLGMDLNAGDASQSPAFYAALIKTPDVLDRLVDTTFTTSAVTKPRTLGAIWGISGGPLQKQRQAVRERLQKVVTSSPSPKLDLVVVRTTTGDPLLSREISDALLRQINWFNLRTRQSRAAAERQFDERLVNEVGADLRRAEDETQQFFQRNQQTHMSAELEMEKQRLARRLEILNARYVSLVTAYDRARIDEVRDTPVITVIQQPQTPVSADSRSLFKTTLLMFLAGLALGVVVAVAREAISSTRRSREGDAREFQHLLDETSDDVRRFWTKVTPRSRRIRGSTAETHLEA